MSLICRVRLRASTILDFMIWEGVGKGGMALLMAMFDFDAVGNTEQLKVSCGSWLSSEKVKGKN